MKELTREEVDRISGGSINVVVPAGLNEAIAAWLWTHPLTVPLQLPAMPPVGGVPVQWGSTDPRDSTL